MIIRQILLKNKKILLIVLAIIFLVALFLFKNSTFFKNTETYQRVGQENGLTYSNETLENLINKDTDNDGIFDWEESLWGTDGTKAETTPGIPDSIAINKLKAEQGDTRQGGSFSDGQVEENLTETEKFSRELFATVAALNQDGQIDQATLDALGVSLALQIQNSAPQKIYVLGDIKTTNNETKEAIEKYRDTLINLYEKYDTAKGVTDILEELVNDEENMDILKDLDPIINQINTVVSELKKMEVPQSISLLHLELINISQRLSENISGIKLIDNDPLMAISAISQYLENALTLESVANRLVSTINQKLNN